MPRQINLGSLTTGMTRLREKGSPSPNALFDLVNGYVDQSGSPVSRPGTPVRHTLPPGTKGGTAFKGKIHVFAIVPIDPGDAMFAVDVLVHPDPAFSGSLSYIHFAKPFLGFLYVVAEFSDGSVYHFWLQQPAAWKANTVYGLNATVSPTVPNGLYYEAETPVNAPAWQPNTAYVLGDTVQPTTPNGYVYTVSAVNGDNPGSGATEPVWPTSPGAQVFEEVDGTTVPSNPTNGAPISTLPASIQERYGNSTQVNS